MITSSMRAISVSLAGECLRPSYKHGALVLTAIGVEDLFAHTHIFFLYHLDGLFLAVG